jgi:Rod binding domain-containing protein
MNVLLPTSAAAVQASVATTPAQAAQHDKLVKAAQEFEASLLQEMLKPMQKDGLTDKDEDSPEDAGRDTLSSYGTEAMAGAIARGGGLGIARHVVAQVERQQMHLRAGVVSKPQK